MLCPQCQIPLKLAVYDQPNTKSGLLFAQWCDCGYSTLPKMKHPGEKAQKRK